MFFWHEEKNIKGKKGWQKSTFAGYTKFHEP
jgi:hypothetical protein